MKKVLFAVAALTLALCPNFVFAKELNVEDNNFEPISQTTKYYKTITYYGNDTLNKMNITGYAESSNSRSYEITKEEYDAAEETEYEVRGSGSIETTYKKMTASISQNGSYYQYKNVLNWKTMPAVRSYDIIGIGHYSSVTTSSVYFNQYYCYSGGSCYTSYSHTPKISANGAATVFKLAEGSLSTLRETIYFNVSKTNSGNTITYQVANGDYSHATTNVSYNNAQNYSIGLGGISLNSSISGSYDSIDTADADWAGSW